MNTSTIWRGTRAVGRLLAETLRYAFSVAIGAVGTFGVLSLLLLMTGAGFVALVATHVVVVQ
jgi:hypothetical protein